MKFQEIKFFHQFNALRFFAAALVLLHHAESLRLQFGLVNLKDWGLFQNGQNAVTFFFVLSGFLITYLLLKEVKTTQTVRIKTFYLKRVYRIWPLYFLLVIIGVVIQPQLIKWFHVPYEMPYTFGETWYYFLFFFPGLVTYYFGSHLLEPLWSIGVEELFYLIWAPLVKLLKRYLLVLLVGIITIKLILFVWINHSDVPGVFRYIVRILQFESMSIGGLGAYLLFYHGPKFSAKFMNILKMCSLVLVVVLIVNPFSHYADFTQFMYDSAYAPVLKALIFGGLLLSLAYFNTKNRLLDSPWMNYLGDISYGIYMYHLLVLTGLVELIKVTHLGIWLDSTLYYVVSFGLTIGIASFSKRFIENYFLRLKSKLHH